MATERDNAMNPLEAQFSSIMKDRKETTNSLEYYYSIPSDGEQGLNWVSENIVVCPQADSSPFTDITVRLAKDIFEKILPDSVFYPPQKEEDVE
jgi:hypothetical protein